MTSFQCPLKADHLHLSNDQTQQREGSAALTSLPASPLNLYMEVKQGFSESRSCPQIRRALSSSQKGSTPRKTLSVPPVLTMAEHEDFSCLKMSS
ncbi:hypothetical protein PAMP_005154 [Pampus punctatissimus]